MYAQNVDLLTMLKYRSIMNWGIAGVIMVGLLALYWVEEDELPRYMTGGLISFLVLRSFLMWREYQDAKEGF